MSSFLSKTGFKDFWDLLDAFLIGMAIIVSGMIALILIGLLVTTAYSIGGLLGLSILLLFPVLSIIVGKAVTG